MEVDMEDEPRANTPPFDPEGFAAWAGAAEAPKRKKKKETWQRSEAKCLLQKDIISGAVPDTMAARDVYLMRDEYKKWPYKNFHPNLERLQEAITKLYKQMCSDCIAYGHDLACIKAL
jgi:hypothetical protein